MKHRNDHLSDTTLRQTPPSLFLFMHTRRSARDPQEASATGGPHDNALGVSERFCTDTYPHDIYCTHSRTHMDIICNQTHMNTHKNTQKHTETQLESVSLPTLLDFISRLCPYLSLVGLYVCPPLRFCLALLLFVSFSFFLSLSFSLFLCLSLYLSLSHSLPSLSHSL